MPKRRSVHRASAAPTPPGPTPLDGQEAVDRIVSLLVSTHITPRKAVAVAIEKFHLTETAARETVDAALARIVAASAMDEKSERGKARLRFEDLYTRAIREGDTKTALAAQKELQRLMCFGGGEGDDEARRPDGAPSGPESEWIIQEAIARSHLEPLLNADPGTPLGELARLAVSKILDLQAIAARTPKPKA